MAAKRKSGKTQPENERHRRVASTRLTLDQLARTDELAAARGITRAHVMAELIDQALDATPSPTSRRTTTAA